MRIAAAVALSVLALTQPASAAELLNVSYDPTREFYRDFNAAFAAHWRSEGGEAVIIHMSHDGSGKQARAVIDGLEADVVTLALAADIDEIAARTDLIPADWQAALPHDSAPYTSTIVFLVRKDNPKQIKDWSDLVRADVAVITPNPKTSGGARWNYLAAWAYAERHFDGDAAKIRDFMARLFKNVPKLDTGARGATMTFVQHGIGDVLLAWENEAYLTVEELGRDRFEIVRPSISILAQPPVALLRGNTEKHGTTKLAQAYLEYLYSPAGQALAAKHYYRPVFPQYAAKEDVARFVPLQLVTIQDAMFGGWQKAQAEHFAAGGIFDQIFAAAR